MVNTRKLRPTGKALRTIGAVGGIVGPVTFAGAWLVGSRRTAGYSMVNDAISRLAAVEASTRPLMTTGFVAFGVGVSAFGLGLRASLPGPAWTTAVATAVATLGVAAFPLDRSSAIDTAHGVAATIGYVTLAATSLLAARSLHQLGQTTAARLSQSAGIVTAGCLAVTALGPAHGLFQRIGVSVGDTWIVAASIVMLLRKPSSPKIGHHAPQATLPPT